MHLTDFEKFTEPRKTFYSWEVRELLHISARTLQEFAKTLGIKKDSAGMYLFTKNDIVEIQVLKKKKVNLSH